MKERQCLIEKVENKNLSIREQCELLSISRACLYYKPKGESEENLSIMKKMDAHYLKHPTHGILRTQDMLQDQDMIVNEKRIRRLRRLMGLETIYPKPNLSKQGDIKYKYPYLLRDLAITHPNHVWAMDITYIPMKSGFMYLTAIIDIYSRYVTGWGISNTLDTESILEVLKEAIRRHGAPEILNTDQGSQFTSKEFTEYVMNKENNYDIKLSMDGKGRAIDNIFIERLWRSVKYDYVYINPASTGKELYIGLSQYFHQYNNKQRHQGINRQIPASIYLKAS